MISRNEKNNSSILANATLILEKLKMKVEPMKLKKEILFDIRGDDEHEEEYKKSRSLVLKVAEASLSETNFFAAAKLVEIAMENCKSTHSDQHDIILSERNDGLEIIAQYRGRYRPDRVAPINLINFADIEESMKQIVDTLFFDWQNESNERSSCKFNGATNEEDSLKFHAKMFALEKICRKQNSDFKFEVKRQADSSGIKFSYNSKKIALAKEFIFSQVLDKNLSNSDEMKKTNGSVAVINNLLGSTPAPIPDENKKIEVLPSETPVAINNNKPLDVPCAPGGPSFY